MANYTLILRDSGTEYGNLSPAEVQAIVGRYGAWIEHLQKAGVFVGSHKLRDKAGRVMRRSSGSVMVTDGPFTEGKEVMGGVFIIQAASFDEAVTVANGCPHLDFGTIEVREVEIMRRP